MSEATMTRRTIGLLVTVALTVLVTPFAAEVPPQATIPRIGYLSDGARRTESEALRQALRALGYVEGQHITVEWRFAETPDQYPDLAAELVGLNVTLLVVRTGLLALAAKQATSTIPIVMAGSGDAVGQGLVANLARPGGNVTGLTAISPDLAPKGLELLKAALPGLSRVAVLWCPVVAGRPNAANELQWREMQVAARVLGLHLQSLEVRSPDDFEALFEVAVRAQADALVTLNCTYTNLAASQIVTLAAAHRLPSLFHLRPPVEAGGLMAYGPDFSDRYHREAVFVDKILKGAMPADLPVEQPTKFELVINLKTTQALGLTMPPMLLFQATEVIR
jgi:putative ABC transport system substrate-binding protein